MLTYSNNLMGDMECCILRKQQSSHENVWNVTLVQFRSECRWLYKAFAGGFMFIQLLLPGWYWLVRQLIKQADLLSSLCIWRLLKDREVVLIRTCSFHLFYFLSLFSYLTIPIHIFLFQNLSPGLWFQSPRCLRRKTILRKAFFLDLKP